MDTIALVYGCGNHIKIGVVDTLQCHMLHHILYSVVIAHVKAGLILKPKPSFMPELDRLLVKV